MKDTQGKNREEEAGGSPGRQRQRLEGCSQGGKPAAPRSETQGRFLS